MDGSGLSGAHPSASGSSEQRTAASSVASSCPCSSIAAGGPDSGPIHEKVTVLVG